MKQFAIQAICDQKVLWEVMNLLEQKHCIGIMARPMNGVAVSPDVAINGVKKKGDRINTVMRLMQEHGPMLPKDMQASLRELGFGNSKVHGILYVLKSRGLVRKDAQGRYGVTKKGTT